MHTELVCNIGIKEKKIIPPVPFWKLCVSSIQHYAFKKARMVNKIWGRGKGWTKKEHAKIIMSA